MAKSITDLRNAVNESAQMISNQLQGVDSNLLGPVIAVIASAFVSNALGIIEYWVPASFIILWILMFNSLTTMLRKRVKRERTVKTKVAISQLDDLFSERNVFLLTTVAKNSASIFKAIGITFFISFIAVVTRIKGIIGTSGDISITIPIITSLLFVCFPFLLHLGVLILEKSDLKKAFRKMGCVSWLIIIVLVLCLSFAIFVLPIWSLVRLYPIYEYSLSGWSLFIVFVLIAVTALTFVNYFSASTVKKEMTIALFNLSKILNRVNMNEVALSQTVNDELYNELVSDYVKAKRYEISADDSLMINFYSLAPNQTYLATIDQKQSETKNETSE